MNDCFRVLGRAGEKFLKGSVAVSGAKNSAVKVMASSLLFEDPIRLSNVPMIEDVKKIAELLRKVGVAVSFRGHDMDISPPSSISSSLSSFLDEEIASKTRSSLVLTGALLGRTGKAVFPNPGGCNLGDRPIDFFLEGYKKMGASVIEKEGKYTVRAKDGLKGTDIFFRVQSHTATETFMMAALLARGTTVLKNCALEPEVKSLSDYLISCGAQISGAGTPTIVIKGGQLLQAEGKIYNTMPDRIEAGSFLILGALAGSELSITKCNPADLEIVIEILRSAGVDIEVSSDSILVRGVSNPKALNIRTHEYPGLPTDLQAMMAVFLTQAKGASTLFETIYGGRLEYLKELEKMGAKVEIKDEHRAEIFGPTPLYGASLKAPDIRAGFALILAGLVAQGETIIHNAYTIDRGYEMIEKKLSALGASIQRIAASDA